MTLYLQVNLSLILNFMISQKEMLTYFLSEPSNFLTRYKKKSLIKAKKAEIGELVKTITADGLETINTAQEGDWLVENQTTGKECYLIKDEIFEKKYELIQSLEHGWGSYRPKGVIYAKQVDEEELKKMGSAESFQFETSWKEPTVLKPGDYLAVPMDKSEIYRIAQKEFGETYSLIRE